MLRASSHLRPWRWQIAWTALLTAVLAAILMLTLRPYGGNVSALLHLDRSTAELHPVPPGFVVLRVPGYDGMQYFHIAREIPRLFSPHDWTSLASSASPGVYSYQRLLLPFLAGVLSFGNASLLPWVLALINMLSLAGAAFLVVRWHRGTPLLAASIALCPAAIIGLHFSLAEPLSILLVTALLLRYAAEERMDGATAAFLALSVVTREVHIFLAAGLLALSLGHRRWKDALLCLPAIALFVAWQAYLALVFGSVPFLASTAKSTVPFWEPLKLVMGLHGFNAYTLSAIALFLLFVLPATILVARDIVRSRRLDPLPSLLLLFLLLMLSTSDIIWGSITSIGRTITPVYPLFVTYAGVRSTRMWRGIALGLIVVGLVTGIALALIPHPFSLS